LRNKNRNQSKKQSKPPGISALYSNFKQEPTVFDNESKNNYGGEIMSENNFYDVKSKFKATKQEPKLS
jgi:hypothetical protein